MTADNAGFQLDFLGFVQNLEAAPTFAQTDQDGITDGLTGKRGPGRPEGHGHLEGVDDLQYTNYFGFALGIHNDFGDEAIETGIRAIRQGAKGVGIHPLLGQKFNQFRMYSIVRFWQHQRSFVSLNVPHKRMLTVAQDQTDKQYWFELF